MIWLEGDVPDEKAASKAERLSGASTHLAHVDLAFPPMPASAEDRERLQTLRDAVKGGKARWDEFDIELAIARELEGALSAIELVADDRDLQDVVDARFVQGAAAHKAFDPESFKITEDAAPFRRNYPGLIGNAPWMLAFALDPTREPTSGDVVDGSTFPDLKELREAFQAVPKGKVDLQTLPPGAELVVNGRVLDASKGKMELPAGKHYVHLMRRGVVSGRAILDLGPNETLPLPMLVDAGELQRARGKVLQGLTAGLPEDVKAGIEEQLKHHQGPVYLAAIDEKERVVVLPYARGAKLNKQKAVTLLLTAEGGGGVIVSPLFDGSNGSTTTAPAILGGLGMELGIYNLALLGGADMAVTPANTITHANALETENVTTSITPRPWGGAGLYVLRPSGTAPTLLLAGTFGWNYPTHLAYGAKVALGVPIDDKGTWFRLIVAGDTASETLWEPPLQDIPMHTLSLRLGLAARL
ncbi:MAG: hypothetical protein EA397_15365 [Deltaproteobacteria bacterium]|nr:MAG: hypothetical protein EA397_15365 [Deltaproteobacteria bacterium]